MSAPPPPPPIAPSVPIPPAATVKPKSKWVVDVPVEVDWKDQYPLHCQAQLGDASALCTLLSGDHPSVDALDDDSWSMLHYAAFYGHTAVVQLLQAHQAKIDVVNGQGATPLHLAAGAGHIQAVDQLLKAGADRTIKNAEKQTPMDLLRQLKPDGWQAVEARLTEP